MLKFGYWDEGIWLRADNDDGVLVSLEGFAWKEIGLDKFGGEGSWAAWRGGTTGDGAELVDYNHGQSE